MSGRAGVTTTSLGHPQPAKTSCEKTAVAERMRGNAEGRWRKGRAVFPLHGGKGKGVEYLVIHFTGGGLHRKEGEKKRGG